MNKKFMRLFCLVLCAAMLFGMIPAMNAYAAAEDTVPMHRLYNPNTGEHFYTGSEVERDNLIAAGWGYEGIAWNAPKNTGAPVYRLYNPNAGDHHYTMSVEERDFLKSLGWAYEGVAWNSAGTDSVPMYRLYNPNAASGSHHYTSSSTERDYLAASGWHYEGIGWYGIGTTAGMTLTLTANRNEVVIGDSNKVYFYAELKGAAQSVMLYDAKTGEAVVQLMDDGQYSASGDDLKDDSIFSGIHYLDMSVSQVKDFYAVAEVYGKTLVSNTFSVNVVAGFSDEELQQMEEVEESIQEEIFSGSFDSMTTQQKEQVTEEVLEDLGEKELIVPDTVHYDEQTGAYSFTYSSGALGLVIIKDWSDDENGGEEALVEMTAEERIAQREKLAGSTSPVLHAPTATDTAYLGDAIVLWSFEQAWDDYSYRGPFYNDLEADFDAMGLQTTVDMDVTVSDYKKLSGYEVIMISGHGANTQYKAPDGQIRTLSSLLLTEAATADKDEQYAADLKQFRIGKINVVGGTKYAILPEFFEYYYDSGDLSGSFIFTENCEVKGKDGTVDNAFSNAFMNASAEAVIGFHNSVMADYSRDLMKLYVEGLVQGLTAQQAFSQATATYGTDDYFPGREGFGPTAYPIFNGDGSAILVAEGLVNGDFEEGTTAVGWRQVGDNRILMQLGNLIPTSNQRMAILTTGIGSAEEDYMSGTEGSVLSQVFKIPEGATRLVFTYNVVSEEPMEFVGTSFDDAFLAQITYSDGTALLATETVNESTWYPIYNINFEGGDDTTYETGWKVVEVDVSQIAGQVVNLEFIVYDVGDSIYDTAALIDNVHIK